MLNSIPQENREAATMLIRQRAAGLGVPPERARRILYWHANKTRTPISSIEMLQEWLANFENLLRAYNQAINLAQLRRQGSAETTNETEE